MVRLGADAAIVRRLFDCAGAQRWNLSRQAFAAALSASAAKAFPSVPPAARDLDRYLEALHVADLALACACADGDNTAWEEFIRSQRPVLYRSADAIDPTGGARELADALYADLYGVERVEGARRSLLRLFHGRSSLATWLRAVLSQRHVDRLRAQRRLEPLDAVIEERLEAPTGGPDPDRDRYLRLIGDALASAVGRLDPRDRLRLGCYYAQELTLAETGRLLDEHEATVSRQLSRTRRVLRADVERELKAEHQLDEAQVVECFASVSDDAGTMDVSALLSTDRKESPPARSKRR